MSAPANPGNRPLLASELDYHLPPGLIAQRPATPRDSSRLLVYHRDTKEIQHRCSTDLISYLDGSDILVYNDSRVIKARVPATRKTGGRVELLFLRLLGSGLWEALVRPSARLKAGEELRLASSARGKDYFVPDGGVFALVSPLGAGRWLVDNLTGTPMEELLEAAGETPLPPYIKEKLQEPERYQTIYAAVPGSAAAPTAGLHFTPELLGRLEDSGVGLFPITLHIGLDTFRPISERDLGRHQIHSEYFRVPPGTYEAVLETRRRGGRVVAVGTTTVRALETVFEEESKALEGDAGLFITPGYRFRAVDALLTNFHLPKSTLLALVMAFAGVEGIRRLYAEAIKERYRFYSFGDATLLL